MNFEPLAQVGVGGIFAILTLRTVFDYLEKRRDRKSNDSDDDEGCTAHVLLQTLHLQNASIENQNKAIIKLLDQGDDTTRVMHRVEKTLDRFDRH